MALTNIVTSLVLDVYDHDESQTTIKAIALDSKTRYVKATLTNMGADYDVDSGAKVILTVLRPDKVGSQVTGSVVEVESGDRTGTINGVYAELSQAALAVKGTLQAQFKIESGDQILRTEIFLIKNGTALDAETDEWAGEYDGYNLDELVEKVDASAAKVDAMETEVSELKSDLTQMLNTAYVTDSASGAIAHFEDGADNIPMKSLKVNIEPVQSGSGDPSPDNARPISGWTGVRVTKAGKNVIPINAKTATASGVTVTINDDGSLLINGTAKNNDGVVLDKNAQLKNYQSGTYALAVFGENTTGLSLQIMNNTAFLPFSANIVTIPDDSTRNYVRIRFANGTTFDNVVAYPMMVYGDTVPTEYEPYNGNVYDISLASAGTVYGGTFDVVSGELTVTHGYIASYNEETLPSTWISDRDEYAEGTRPTTGAQVVYLLTTPTVHHLTPTEVKSLLGINNVWSDAGDTTVEYRADTKLYIDKKLAEVTA